MNLTLLRVSFLGRQFNRSTARNRKGLASVLAMLYLVLFSTLAVGFYEATSLSAQVSRNEMGMEMGRSAADSGLQYMRYQLGSMMLPPGTNSGNLLTNVATALGTNMNGNANMGGNTVVVTAGTTIYLPSQSGWMTIDSTSARFQASITQSGNNLVVTVHGTGPSGVAARGVQLQFQPAPTPYALIGVNNLTVSGGAFTDSYNATKGAYVQASADHTGAIASNGNITLQNTAKVNGDVRCGVTGTTTIKDTASATGLNTPLFKNNTYTSVTLPATYTDLGDVTMSSGTTSIPGGTYLIHNLNLSGTAHVIWTGPTKLYIQNSYNVTQGVQIDTAGNLPVNRQLYFLPTCTTATWSGTNVCVGDLYAPDTDFTISGSVQMMGRITAKTIANSSTGGMHYDESLAAVNGQGGYMPMQGSYIEVQ